MHILIQYPSIENETSTVITNIYNVFIETKYFVFLAVLKKEFLKIFSWCKHCSLVIIPRKQFVYQESNCHCTVRSGDYIGCIQHATDLCVIIIGIGFSEFPIMRSDRPV